MACRAVVRINDLTLHHPRLVSRIDECFMRAKHGAVKDSSSAYDKDARHPKDPFSLRHHRAVSADFYFTYHACFHMARKQAGKIHRSRLIELPYQATHLAWV